MKIVILISFLIAGCSSEPIIYKPLRTSPVSNFQTIKIVGNNFEIDRNHDVKINLNGKDLTKKQKFGTIIKSQGFLILNYNDFEIEKMKFVEANGMHYLMDSLAYEIWEKTGKITEHGQILVKN